MKELADFRREYSADALSETDMPQNPMDLFIRWMEKTIESGICEPNAMVIATATPDGKPSARVVLLKEANENGFVFYTNYLSRKGRELMTNPFASVVFDWHQIERQIRIEGRVERLSPEDSDSYFNSRPEASKLGAWTSPQSKIIKNRDELNELQTEVEKRFSENPIPRPDFWGGFLIRPTTMEFWQGRPSRLHDRLVYHKTEEGWTLHRLAP